MWGSSCVDQSGVGCELWLRRMNLWAELKVRTAFTSVDLRRSCLSLGIAKLFGSYSSEPASLRTSFLAPGCIH